ncbi:aspergillopepsin A-like aspartic endopeptidase [Penicillium herquei]|nr:aspergillopepsin A-like aspartic endopeptidase [Penicillium herquei]
MIRLLSILFIIFLSYEALAAPALYRPLRKGKSFKVERIKRSGYVRNGPAALRKAYRKFGATGSHMDYPDSNDGDFDPFPSGMGHQSSSKTGSSTSSSSSSSATTDTNQEGSVSVTSVDDGEEFVSPVLIGGQNITLDFDTGSADMWVINSELPSEDTEGHEVYDPSSSSTFEYVEGDFEVEYGDGSYVAGYLGKDTVSIGGVEVADQVFGLPVEVSSTFIEDTSSNGLVGLSFSSINSFNPGPQKTFFDNVAPDLDEPVFTSRLRSDGVGEYGFGTIDHSLYSGTLANVSVDSSNGYWQFNSTTFKVGDGHSWNISDTTTSIADTGTTLLLVSADVVSYYYGKVSGSTYSSKVGGYIYPCDADLPDLALGMGESSYQAIVPGSVLNYAEVGTNSTTGETSNFCFTAVCYGGVQSCAGYGFQIFGDIFLRSFYVVFDKRGPSLGVASSS